MKRSLIAGLVAASSLLIHSGASVAGISLNGTRVVYTAQSKEASVLVRNSSKQDVMIQSWLESDDRKSDLPFAITPSLSRLGAEKQQTLRIFYAGQGLPTDRESVFWLSVQEIPQKPDGENTLQVAVRQRIKLFYRPTNLAGKPEDAPKQLQWRWRAAGGKYGMEVVNNTPYFVSLVKATLHSGMQTHPIGTEMIPPQSTRQLSVKNYNGQSLAPGAKVDFESINDFGAVEENNAAVSN
ncbi:fimbrial biogenesis chaperone [Burkholderia diffusa]|uniref:fimbrial biogenesis chaperone n=1 Tax=Burkholderia diffusa TaxID=488732 RepID=UPI00157ABA17|nr:fimbria/pilus periplasmic chaperone [Burkholderia diffusa]NTY34964.1 molecular chaperone [Burkholderia diffusa]